MFLCLPVFSQKSTILNLKSIRIDDFYLICPTAICQAENVFVSWEHSDRLVLSFFLGERGMPSSEFSHEPRKSPDVFRPSFCSCIETGKGHVFCLIFLRILLRVTCISLFSWNMVNQDFPWWLFYQSPYFIKCHINSFIYTFCCFMQNRDYGEMAAWWCGNYTGSQVQ